MYLFRGNKNYHLHKRGHNDCVRVSILFALRTEFWAILTLLKHHIIFFSVLFLPVTYEDEDEKRRADLIYSLVKLNEKRKRLYKRSR